MMQASKPLSPDLDGRSRALRRLVLDAFIGGGRGHVPSALSLIEILRVLYDDVMHHRPTEPKWPDRDRCILSKGHGCLALYAVLADHGYFPAEALATFCKRDSLLGGHPETRTPGVETSTGALGHGLSVGLGMALAARLQKRPSRIFVVMGDGEIDEGSVWEAALCAAKHGTDNLTAVIDYNKLQSFGPVAKVQPLEPLADKWRAFGWAVRELDGHDVAALRDGFLSLPATPGRPTVLIAHTVKGKGIPFIENDPSWHHKNAVAADIHDALYASVKG